MQIRTQALDRFDWSKINNLRLRASAVAEGLYVGSHRSLRPGSGIEFSGHRNYVPGDDLRWLDRHALMRHDRLLVREFETETDRVLRFVVDATASMGYQSRGAPATKLQYASLLAAVLAKVAIAGGDPVAVDWLGGTGCRWLPPVSGGQAFDRIVGALELAQAAGEFHADLAAIDQAFTPVLRYARRGTSIVVFTDLAELPDAIVARTSALSTRGRRVVLARILDPAEADFSFRGPLRLRATEGPLTVTTDAASRADHYRLALHQESTRFAATLAQRGARFLTLRTDSAPVAAVRNLILALGGRQT
jgi:uncharacterized protein (DUF58 family)